MKQMKSAFKILLVAVILVGGGAFIIAKWSWVFAKKVKGEIVGVERVTQPTAILSSRATDAQIHSYSVLIKGEDGKLYTSSSEDRQWQVAKPGYCVEALLYVYPPWDFDHAGTYFNARLIELSECPGKPVTSIPQTMPEQGQGMEPPAGPDEEDPSNPPNIPPGPNGEPPRRGTPGPNDLMPGGQPNPRTHR